MKKSSLAKRIKERKKQLLKRLAKAREERWVRGFRNPQPVIASNSVKYELAERAQAFAHGGLTALLKLASDVGLADNINKHVQLLKWHAPYHESDHVLNFAANALCNGTRLQHLELLRNNAAYLDAIGADSIPDPTTAGDFCRRFKQSDIDALLLAINETRLNVWKQQEASFFEQAIIDVDGVIVTTKGEFKGGMDITFKGSWGYHPLLISLANTKEVMGLKYRSISSSFDADSKRWISSSFSST